MPGRLRVTSHLCLGFLQALVSLTGSIPLKYVNEVHVFIRAEVKV